MDKLLLRIVCLLALSTCSICVFPQDRKKLRENRENFELETLGIGEKGTKFFKVRSYGKDKDAAVFRAKQDAVYACLFRGLPPGNGAEATPAICSSGCYEQYSDFFERFFSESGEFMRFVNQVGFPSGPDLLKVKQGFKIGLSVQVTYDNLRKFMEDKGMVQQMAATLDDSQKPVIMVVPSRTFCETHRFITNSGEPDYEKALTDRTVNSIIAQLAQIMADRGYPLVDLLHILEKIKKDGLLKGVLNVRKSPIDELIAQTAQIDFRLDLDYSIQKKGYSQYATFTLKGIDAATGETVSSVADMEGVPSSVQTAETLLLKSILSQMDTFNAGLMGYFKKLSTEGRLITLDILMGENSDTDFNRNYTIGGKTGSLSIIIYAWLREHIAKQQNIKPEKGTNALKYKVRIPLRMKEEFTGESVSIDAPAFAMMLCGYLQSAPFNLQVEMIDKGIGEAMIVIQ